MSIKGEDVDHSSTIEDLLFALLVEQRVTNKHLAELTDLNNSWERDDEEAEVDL